MSYQDPKYIENRLRYLSNNLGHVHRQLTQVGLELSELTDYVEQQRVQVAPSSIAWPKADETPGETRPSDVIQDHVASSQYAEPVNDWESQADQEPSGWEFSLGITWFSRLGIAALLIGVAIALNYAFPFFPPELKLAFGGLLAVFLFLTGQYFRERFSLLGQALEAGGLSVGYITLFAMCFIPQVQLVTSPMAGTGLLLAYTLMMTVLAHRLKSQTVALISMIYGYFTASYAGEVSWALMTSTLLSIVALSLSVLNPSWRILNKFVYVCVLVTMGYWHVQDNIGATSMGQTYLWGNYALFQFASFLPAERRDFLLQALSAFGLILTAQWTIPDLRSTGWTELIAGALQCLGLLLPDDGKSRSGQFSLLLASVFFGLGFMQLFSHQDATMVLSAEALILGILAKRSTDTTWYRWASYGFWSVAVMVFLIAMMMPSSSTLVLSAVWVGFIGIVLERMLQGYERVGFLTTISNGLIWLVATTELHSQWITLSYVLSGFAILATGLLLRDSLYRKLGICWFAVAALRLFFVDLAALATPHKILVFLATGVLLLLASYGYSYLEKQTAGNSSDN